MTARFAQGSIAALMAGTMAVVSTGAAAQTAPAAPAPAPAAAPAQGDNEVEAVIVQGRRSLPPGTDAPKSATCEFLIANDPVVRAQLAMVAQGGNALMGPRIYLPTRPPRENDYAAAPKSPPGSPIPDAGRRWRASINSSASSTTGAAVASLNTDGSANGSAITGATATDASQAGSADASANDGEGAGAAALDDFSIEQAVDACRATFSRGGAPVARGRAEIARRDTTLPNGFVLFDDGRYEEALGQFKQTWAKLQPEEGGDEAALMIGKIYLRALGEKSDAKEAVVWLKRAAEGPFNPTTSMPQFDPTKPENTTAMGEAAMMLASLYTTGAQGVAKDPAQARKWLERADTVGYVPAAKKLGDIYYYGVDTPKDLKKAAAYYKEAAGLGYAPAQFALGEMYYAGELDGKVDVAKALAWYNEAAKLEEPNACYALAVAYDTGDGVPANPQRAVGFYRIAALKGHVPSMTALGTYFYEGGLVQKDLATARRWFDTAAKSGDRDAMFNVAAMMMKGEGGPIDRAHAWAWFKLAQAKGKPEAAAAIAALERQMSADEKAQAAKLIAPAAT